MIFLAGMKNVMITCFNKIINEINHKYELYCHKTWQEFEDMTDNFLKHELQASVLDIVSVKKFAEFVLTVIVHVQSKVYYLWQNIACVSLSEQITRYLITAVLRKDVTQE